MGIFAETVSNFNARVKADTGHNLGEIKKVEGHEPLLEGQIILSWRGQVALVALRTWIEGEDLMFSTEAEDLVLCGDIPAMVEAKAQEAQVAKAKKRSNEDLWRTHGMWGTYHHHKRD